MLPIPTQQRAGAFLAGLATAGAAYAGAQVCVCVCVCVERERGESARAVPIARSSRPPLHFSCLSLSLHSQRTLWASTRDLAGRLPNPPAPPPSPAADPVRWE